MAQRIGLTFLLGGPVLGIVYSLLKYWPLDPMIVIFGPMLIGAVIICFSSGNGPEGPIYPIFK